MKKALKTNIMTVTALTLALACLSAITFTQVQGAFAQEKSKDKSQEISRDFKVEKADQVDHKEQFERNVDQVALLAQESSISKLTGLISKYHGTRQEAILLAKLAELQSQNASIKFRIAHGVAHRTNKTPDLSSYKREMQKTIATLTDLIKKFPNYEELYRSYFLRGKSFEEIEDKASATQDYLFLVKSFPEAEESISAYMSLAEFSIQANDHAKAIEYLVQVEKHPESNHFPFALYKLAWAHYNLKGIQQALHYVEKNVEYYNQRKNASQGDSFLSSSDEALRENTLLDSTVFYMDGIEPKISQFKPSEGIDYFRKLESGPVLGKMLIRFSKLLRTHGQEEALINWKNQILKEESARPESLDVILIVFENQLNRRRLNQFVESAHDMVSLYAKHKEFESFTKAQKMLLDTADVLHELIIKNKGAEGVSSLSTILASVYDSFTHIVEESDPRIPRVNYNLAETLFEIKDYEKATFHYRWIVQHGDWKLQGPASVADASLKAIASQYEYLREKHLIPEKLDPKSFSASSDRMIDPKISEWIGWVDTHVKKTGNLVDNFYFEANRCLYGYEHVKEAVDRLREFAILHPDSKFAVPSATLTLDTFIKSGDWEALHDLATELLEVKAWKKTEFSKRLFSVAADASFKTLELRFKSNDYIGASKRADEFLARYGTSERLADALYLAGSSALAQVDKKRANQYFSRLIQDAPSSGNLGPALLHRATFEEDHYLFSEASRDYTKYLELNPKKSEPILAKKALIYAWLSNSSKLMSETIASKAVCNDKLTVECDRANALLQLHQASVTPVSEEAAKLALEKARDGVDQNKAVWAAVALENPKAFNFHDRLSAIRNLAQSWDALDALVRYSLLPKVSLSLPLAFRMNRLEMDEVAPLRATAKYITRRVEVIKEMERVAAKVVTLPWSRIRGLVLNESASLYLDLSQGIRKLPAPKDLSTSDRTQYEDTIASLVIPFEEKGQDMRSKAYEIASRFAIEDKSFKEVSEPFFLDNPNQAKKLKPEKAPASPESIGLLTLLTLDPTGDWDHPDTNSLDPAKYIKSLWVEALKNQRWQQVGFFMQEAQEKALIQAGAMSIVKALSLAAAGARGEALPEFDEARVDLPVQAKKEVTLLLISHYLASYSKEKTKQYLEEMRQFSPEDFAAINGRSPAAASGKTNRAPTKLSASQQLLKLASEWVGG